MTLRIRRVPFRHSPLLRRALRLHALVLGRPLPPARLRRILRGRHPLLLVAVDVEKRRVVGYKFGFEERPGRFYSWIGGVHPRYRRRGLGRALMERQHFLLLRAGYKAVRTSTTNRHRSMLILNLRSGFDVIGTTVDRRRELKIHLEKRL